MYSILEIQHIFCVTIKGGSWYVHETKNAKPLKSCRPTYLFPLHANGIEMVSESFDKYASDFFFLPFSYL